MSLSLTEPIGQSPILAASEWLRALTLGQTATAIAVLGVASVGFAMLTGRMPVGHAVRVILGCFILFGAPAIVDGLMQLTSSTQETAAVPQPSPPGLGSPPVPSRVTDPYAGAAVPTN